MAFISLRQLLDLAAEGGYAVPSFNVNNLEQFQAVMSAAAEVDSPAILQPSSAAKRSTVPTVSSATVLTRGAATAADQTFCGRRWSSKIRKASAWRLSFVRGAAACRLSGSLTRKSLTSLNSSTAFP